MIGLIEMIRGRVRREWGLQDSWAPRSRFCLARNPGWAYPVSRRYYELLDGCETKHPPQSSFQTEGQ